MNIIFICTGNTCRSPMAQALTVKKAKQKGLDITCSSKGICAFTGDTANINAVEAMKEYGIDISSHRAGKLSVYDVDSADLLVCMAKEHAAFLSSAKEKTFVLGGGIPDPYGMGIDAYKECARQIDTALDAFLDAFFPEIKISAITQDDVPLIAEIEKDCFSVPWSEKAIFDELGNESARFFILRKNGDAVGYMGMHIVLDECYVANLAVKRNARHQGLGEKLLCHCIETAKSEGCSFISLEVRVSNSPAISLYKKHGFSSVGERKNFYTDPAENALIMTKYFSEVD